MKATVNNVKELGNVTFEHLGMNMELSFDTYANGGVAIQIYCQDAEFGFWEPFMTVTSYIGKLKEDEVAIKTYFENEGAMDLMLLHGIVKPPHRYQGGFPICKLNYESISRKDVSA